MPLIPRPTPRQFLIFLAKAAAITVAALGIGYGGAVVVGKVSGNSGSSAGPDISAPAGTAPQAIGGASTQPTGSTRTAPAATTTRSTTTSTAATTTAATTTPATTTTTTSTAATTPPPTTATTTALSSDGSLRLKILSATLQPEVSAYARARRRARFTVRLSATNLAATPHPPLTAALLTFAQTKVRRDFGATAAAAALEQPIAPQQTAVGEFHFETAGDITKALQARATVTFRVAGAKFTLPVRR